MNDLTDYIEDYILGHSIPEDIKRAFEDRLESDSAFREDIEQYRETIEVLQIHGIKKRITQNPEGHKPTKQNKSTRKWHLAGILFIVAIVILIYLVKTPKSNHIEPEETPVIDDVNPSNENGQPEVKEMEENEPANDVETNEKQVPIAQDVSPSEPERPGNPELAMAYFEKRMPVYSGTRGDEDDQSNLSSDERALQACIDLLDKKLFNQAASCLENKFGDREEDAQWYRALATLANEGNHVARHRIEKIAGDRLHIYRRQARELLEEL